MTTSILEHGNKGAERGIGKPEVNKNKLANHMCDAENKTILFLPSILMRTEGIFFPLTKNTFERARKYGEFDQRHDSMITKG